MSAPIKKKKKRKNPKSTTPADGPTNVSQSHASTRQPPNAAAQSSTRLGLGGLALGPPGRMIQGFNLVRNATQALGFRQPDNVGQFLMESGMYYVPWGARNRTLRIELRRLKDVVQSRTNQLVIDINREIDNALLGSYQPQFIPEAAALINVQSPDVGMPTNPGNPTPGAGASLAAGATGNHS